MADGHASQVTRQPSRRSTGVAIALALAVAAQPSIGAAHGPPMPSVSRFLVTYAGSGSWRTAYRSEPPNPGGNPDADAANDSSTQRWALTFSTPLTVPRCGRPRGGARDRCRDVASLTGAHGATAVVGHVAHSHIDGLFPAQNGSVSCELRAATPARARVEATVRIRYRPAAGTILVTALIPVANALNLLPGACPEAPDGLDGLLDNYFTPGFSFASGFGPARWFSSQTVAMPVARLRRATRIRLRVSSTRAGTPPAGCAVPSPAFEQCSTGGSWAGVLTLSRRR